MDPIYGYIYILYNIYIYGILSGNKTRRRVFFMAHGTRHPLPQDRCRGVSDRHRLAPRLDGNGGGGRAWWGSSFQA